ncbi:NAD-dependent epimerase/dehydratase family protein [Aliidiomarina sanyensis]|uniref:UDP-glucose 4-epimerase n=1 Tax=Aliidiomarina sanyensis TaxID=1249555 RepID=A0A432WAV1_9GAMM|nr:NAD-dependent epimerase/dehydratase family protein [Aliidiomarina sanyensis]RUO27868.1 UDP-glucose 4-epimerase [Aliidiomarina sanyensis]
MISLAITGSSGFVGSHLIRSLRDRTESKYHIACLAREDRKEADAFIAFDLSSEFQLESFLTSTDVIIHCAARVHQMSEGALASDNQYVQANVVATARLAQQAAAAGAKRFIFLSSVKALGESTAPNEAYRFDSAYNPQDPYGESKAEAEKELVKIARETGMEVTIIRAPLVYGPGVKANFASLLKLAEKNLPLPLGSVNNARSMVGIQNLVDLIVTCIDHPNAGNQIFMASDGHDVSTSELLKEMTRAFGKKPRLLPFPMSLMSFAARLVGKGAIADRLFGSLRVDIEHTKKTLDWVPKVSLQEELARCVEYMKGQEK